jgi:hypothetical protein
VGIGQLPGKIQIGHAGQNQTVHIAERADGKAVQCLFGVGDDVVHVGLLAGFLSL